MKNKCRTYFAIDGYFNVEEISIHLGLEPDKVLLFKNSQKRAIFLICTDYDPYLEKQLLATIKPLIDKTTILKDFAKKNKVKYYLAAIPEIVVDSVYPSLSPSLEVMKFCVEIEAELDYDLCLYCDKDTKDVKA